MAFKDVRQLPKSLMPCLGRFFVAKYLTIYTHQDPEGCCSQNTPLLPFAVNTTGAIKLMGENFPKFRLPRDSYGVNDLGSY